jgi:subtilisin family serine protease
MHEEADMRHGTLDHGRRSTALGPVALALFFAALLVGVASGAGSTKPLVAAGSVATSPGLAADLANLPSATPYGAFVHFSSGTPAEHRALLSDHGLVVTADFESTAQAVFAVGTVGEIRALTREPSVSYLEENRRLAYSGDTAVWASRSRVAQERVSGGPYFNAGGDVLTGKGVGVAIVDSGINANHPDLTNRVGKNFKIVCTTPGLVDTSTGQCFGPLEFVDVGNTANTDTTSGHGTHVSGIVAGDGTQSTGLYPVPSAAPNVKGTFTGVAPGATLHGFSTGEVIVVLYATEAWQYIFDHYDDFEPRIKVINNSFGEPGGASYNPDSIDAKLVKALVEQKGVTFTFSAGNSGGDGSADTTSSYCDDPTPGVICVANYDDASPGTSPTGTGNRDSVLNSTSSRGLASSSGTWPDISAPGTFYTAACIRGVQPVCATGIVNEARWGGFYGSISGTSMSSPHTAGAAALLLEARPDLTPGAIEDTLLDTAHKFTAGGAYVADPQNAGETHSFDKGAGLLDVPATLAGLGVAHGDGGGGGGTGTPQVRITDPAEGSEFDGTGSITVQGTADDGTRPAAVPAEQVILDGDGGDFDGPGAADIVKLTVQETPAGAPVPGLTYRYTVRNAPDFGGAPSITMRVTQNVDGRPFQTNVSATPLGVAPAGGTAPATVASRSGNTIEFFVPLANVGNPPAGAPVHNIFASSFINVIVDYAPSPNPSSGVEVNTRPMLSKPFTILRPQAVTPPTAAVSLSLDGGPEQATALTGTSPSYAWSTSVDLVPLVDGPHTLEAILYLDGVEAARHQVTIVVERAQQFTYDVVITSPNDGDVVPRATVEVRGTSITDDPSPDRRVTLTVFGPDSSPEADAVGTAPWTHNVNFDRSPGLYTLTARFYVGGDLKATHSINVVVPPPSGNEVSCAGRPLGFWRPEFDMKDSGRKFTAAEAETLAFHAVGLSDGYFENRDELVAALNAKGSLGLEERAARQYAALLLNLAGGDLSGSMSYQAGLSGAEGLQPKVYDTATVGSTVDEAADWVRAQLPAGDLGGANEVADAINHGHGLNCD